MGMKEYFGRNVYHLVSIMLGLARGCDFGARKYHMKTDLFALVIAMSFTTASVCAQSRATTIENITNEEFLQLYFRIELHQHEGKDALNSFNLITFYPST